MTPGAGDSKKWRDLGNWVTEQLAERLFSGTYKPGDMLPKETDLVEALSVSRASVRSGLQTLTVLGIIKRQPGKGTVVEEYREWNLLDPMVTRWMVEYPNPHPEFLKEVFDFRHAIEPYVSAIAATRATAHDLAEIEAAFLAMEKTQSYETKAEFSQADIAFHAAIYRATHNLIWSQLAHILRPAILMVIQKSNMTADELSDSLARHRHLMECIRLRQPAKAYAATVRVLERTAFDLGFTPSSIDNQLLALMKAQS